MLNHRVVSFWSKGVQRTICCVALDILVIRLTLKKACSCQNYRISRVTTRLVDTTGTNCHPSPAPLWTPHVNRSSVWITTMIVTAWDESLMPLRQACWIIILVTIPQVSSTQVWCFVVQTSVYPDQPSPPPTSTASVSHLVCQYVLHLQRTFFINSDQYV